MKKWIKITSIIVLAVGSALIVAAILAPGLIKDYVEEHDTEFCGREITIGDLSINYFTFASEIRDFKIMEPNSSDVFVAFDLLKLDIEMWHALRNSIYIRDYYLENLKLRVVQNQANFNFDDLLALASDSSEVEAPKPVSDSKPWTVTFANTKVVNARIDYSSDISPVVVLDSIQINVPFASDTSSVIETFTDLVVGTGGRLSINTVLKPKITRYKVDLLAEELNLKLVENYFYDFLKVSDVQGVFNSKFSLGGNYAYPDTLEFGGSLGMDGFNMFDSRKEKILGLEHGEIVLDTVRLHEGIYNIKHMKAAGFYTIYELYADGGDNWTNFMDVTGEPAMVPDSAALEVTSTSESDIDYSNPFVLIGIYLKEIVRNYAESSYRVGEISIEDSAFDFVDYTPEDPFRYSFADMGLHADKLNSVEESITFEAQADLNGSGRLEGYIRNYTRNLSDFDMHYEIRGTDLVPFSPYTRYYVDYPILLGEMLYVNDTKIRNGQITSSNVIDCDQFNFGKRVDGKAIYNLPVKLAVSLLKDVKGNIHIDIPVEGNVDDPKFKIGKFIWQTVKNLVVKAVTAPFRLLKGLFTFDTEELKTMRFGLLQFNLNMAETKQLQNLAKVITKKPELNLDFRRVTRQFEEAEKYAVLASKYNFLYSDTPADPDQMSQEVRTVLEEFDINDSLFVSFLDANIGLEYRESAPQRKCLEMITEERATMQTDRLGAIRNAAIRDYLVREEGIDSTRIRFSVLPNDSLSTNRSNLVYNVDFWVEE